MSEAYRDYGFPHAGPSHMHADFMPVILRARRPFRIRNTRAGRRLWQRVHVWRVFGKLGCHVVGVDLSETGIRNAREEYPACRFERASAG